MNERRVKRTPRFAVRRTTELHDWTCPWCGVLWLGGDPFADCRISQDVIGCPNCGNYQAANR